MATTPAESSTSRLARSTALNAEPSKPESSTVPSRPMSLPDAVEPRTGEAAFQRLAPLLNALNENDLPRVNLDITATVVSSLGALPKLRKLRTDIVTFLPYYDLTLFDAFEDIVTALSYVDSVLRASSEDRKDVTAQAHALDAKRALLYQAAQMMVGIGLLDEKPLRSIKTQVGYKPLVSDVGTLVQLLGQNWSQVQGKIPFTLKDLNTIDAAALALGTALGLKEQKTAMPRETVMRRRKVFALFRQALTQLRRAVHYLHGEDAVNEIIPSFSNAAGRSARAQPELNTQAAAASPVPTTEAFGQSATGATPRSSAGL